MLLSTCILAFGAASFDLPVKHIGAPSADLHSGWLREPDPSKYGIRAHHSMHTSIFRDDRAEFRIEVPGGPRLKLLPAGDDADRWFIHAVSPSGQIFDGSQAQSRLRRGSVMPGSSIHSQRLDIDEPEPGSWIIQLMGGHDGHPATLLVEDGLDLHLRAWLDDYATHRGDTVTVHVGCSLGVDVDESGHVARGRASQAGVSIISLSSRVHHADGTASSTVTRDQTIQFPAARSGVTTVSIEAVLIDASGNRFHRNASLLVAVEEDIPKLSGQIETIELDSTRTAIDIGIVSEVTRDRVMTGAEIWATSSDGHRPRCWIGGIAPLTEDTVRLVLDTRWLYGCDPGTAEIRSLRLADVDTYVPLARIDHHALPNVRIAVVSPTGSDIQLMQTGAMMPTRTIEAPLQNRSAPLSRAAQYGGHNLMLVHGYCEDGDAWPLNQFSGAVTEYENLYQNFSHDQFALDIIAFGNQYKSYSVIGHSQGGNAGLHMYAFYWSGIDWSTGERKVQMVGTPLRGTPLAGSIADLGEIFGIQCGSNYDMTYDGAAQWASFIPGWARQDTWVWSTTFEDGWFYDYCNIGSDLLLWDPEDGVVEVSGAHLDGTNDMGTKEGWCHIENMADPAQTIDTERNTEMNVEGAR